MCRMFSLCSEKIPDFSVSDPYGGCGCEVKKTELKLVPEVTTELGQFVVVLEFIEIRFNICDKFI